MNIKLLDRNKETSDLIEIINSSIENNKIILLAGTSGIGKSSLVQKFHVVPY